MFSTAGSAVRWIGALATLASVTNFGTARPGGTKPKSRVDGSTDNPVETAVPRKLTSGSQPVPLLHSFIEK